MRLSVIIVNYNVVTYLRQCLNALYRSKDLNDWEIIVIDNHSHDNSCDMVQNEFPQVCLVKLKKNVGYSKAVNEGLKRSKGETICLLNPDTLVSEDVLSILKKYLKKNPNVGVVGCKVLDADGHLQLASRRVFPTLRVMIPQLLGLSRIFPSNSWFGRYNQTYINPNSIQDVDAVSGALMMIPNKIFKKVGPFDDQFFLYFEDTDFCHRVKDAGYRVVYNPESQIIHYKGESHRFAPFDLTEVFHESMYQFYRKYSHKFKLWPLMNVMLKSTLKVRSIFLKLKKQMAYMTAIILDSVFIVLSFIFSILIWYPYKYGVSPDINLTMKHWDLTIAYITAWFIVAGGIRLYRKNTLSYGRALAASVIAFLISAVSTYFISIFAYSRAVLAMSFGFSTFFISSWRIIVHLMYRYRLISLRHTTSLFSRRAVILGTDNESVRIGELLVHIPDSSFDLIGYTDHINKLNLENSPSFLGWVRDLPDIVRTHNINELILPEKRYEIGKIIEILQSILKMNVSLKIVPDGRHYLVGKGIVENLGGVPLVDIEFPLFDRLHLFAKRVFDVLASFIFIIVTAPVHLYCYFVLGTKQRKIWTTNHTFLQLAEYNTSIHFFRELPYLFAIFSGNISFVGSHIVDFTKIDPSLLFKPGLTGLSQLKTVEVNEEMYASFDQYYMQNHSFFFDIEIIMKSILGI